MDQRERLNDDQEVYMAHGEALQAKLWTALPGIVDTYDHAKLTATVKPTIKMQVRDAAGNWQWTDLPLLRDVPVVFPSAGGFSLTLPIAAGDEVLVVFASRCIDAWWSAGGVQIQSELRMHDLSDGFCLPGPCSQPRRPSAAPNAASLQLRKNDGSAYVEITAGGVVNIVAPGGFNINGNTIVTGTMQATGEGTFNGGHTVSAHKHGGITAGGGQTATPTG